MSPNKSIIGYIIMRMKFDGIKMKRVLVLLTVTLIISILTVTGCQPAVEEDGTEIRLARIHEVQVNIAESYPPQVFVYIKGGLPDSCTTFHEFTTERRGNTINIEVTTQRPKGAVCAQVYTFFEKNISLGSDFTLGETYIVEVNDKSTSFTLR